MVFQINYLRVVLVTGVDHYQYFSQIQVILRRLESSAPLWVVRQSVLRIHLNCVLWVRPAVVSRGWKIRGNFLFLPSTASDPSGRRNIDATYVYPSLVVKTFPWFSLGLSLSGVLLQLGSNFNSEISHTILSPYSLPSSSMLSLCRRKE